MNGCFACFNRRIARADSETGEELMGKNSMKVLVTQRLLPHYRIPLFKKLNDALDGDLTVAHGEPRGEVPEREPKDLGFRRIIVRNQWLFGERLLFQNFSSAFRTCDPDVVVTEHAVRNLGAFHLMEMARKSDVPVLLWGPGRSQWRPLAKRDIRNTLHRWLIGNANGYIAYTHSRAKEVSKLLPKKPVFWANNTIDTQLLGSIKENLEAEGEEAVKKRLGLSKPHYILFIGRIHSDKEPGIAVRLAKLLKEKKHDIGVLFIGDGPERAAVELMASTMDGVHFLGTINDWAASASYIFASSMLVMPQWLGLAANHCISLGTPVITFTPRSGGAGHPPEIDYVVDDVTGFQIAYNDLEAMVDVAEKILKNRDRFKAQCARFTAEEISIDRWVDGMVSAIRSVTLKEPED